MAIINQAAKEITIKIVYYGPELAGKTTNLTQIHEHLVTTAGNKGKLVTLQTSSDRTLFFDFIPMETKEINGFRAKFQLHTVPGRVIYNTSKQLVLRGVDGIVFVADSQYEMMPENVRCLKNLEENLRSLRLDLADIPLIFQYNKRDLPEAMPFKDMGFLLNIAGLEPSFPAVASRCEGVLETLNVITDMVTLKLFRNHQPA